MAVTTYHVVLRERDGYSGVTPELRPAVKALQRALERWGASITVDGWLGANTVLAVKAFQSQHGLVSDGIVGPNTWKHLLPYLRKTEQKLIIKHQVTPEKPEQTSVYLPNFHGDLSWVYKWESHVGYPYWPGGDSGITLDPGFDLGYQRKDRGALSLYYKEILGEDEIRDLQPCLEIKGEQARDLLISNSQLEGIKISEDEAFALFPVIAQKYWRGITERFPELIDTATPGSVQTALLSLSYNRGYPNPGLKILHDPINDHDWEQVAELIGDMQQTHKLQGIRRRRREEAELIRSELRKVA